MKKRIYLAGNETGEDYLDCRLKFQEAQKRLEKRGFEVVNPLDLSLDIKGNDYTYAEDALAELLANRLIAIQSCQVVYLLPDWDQSIFVQVEACFARRQGIWLIHENIENTAE
ncbi:MAG: DUF4406 domain-containing protein [Flavobacteriales bacterium]